MVSQIDRLSRVLKGNLKSWNDINISAMEEIVYMMTPSAIETLTNFKLARSAKSFKDRLRLLNVSGIYRQTRQGTLSLFIAVLFKKI
jgi:hypothetical protein